MDVKSLISQSAWAGPAGDWGGGGVPVVRPPLECLRLPLKKKDKLLKQLILKTTIYISGTGNVCLNRYKRLECGNGLYICNYVGKSWPPSLEKIPGAATDPCLLSSDRGC